MFGGTQVFSAGFAQAERSGLPQEPQAKKGRQEERQTCLPVSVRAIERAVEQRADAGGDLHFHGSEPGMLVLVGLVETMTRQAASVEFSLNDATGRLKARHYVSSQQAGGLDGLEAGRYVSVFGAVRTAPEVHFAVAGMSLVQSADEVSYHMIEVAYAALNLQRAGMEATTPAKKSAGAEVDLSPPKTERPPAADAADLGGAAPKAPLAGSGLRKAILRFIKTEGDGKPEGVSFPAVCSHADSTPADDVSAALEKLVEAGELYTTIDDGHFQCI